MKFNKFIGVDISAAHVRIGIVDASGHVEDFSRLRTSDVFRSANTLSWLSALIKHQAGWPDVDAVCIGLPGTMDKKRQTVIRVPSFPLFDGMQLARRMEEQLGLPVFVERTVNLLMNADLFFNKIPPKGIVSGFYFKSGVGNSIFINGEVLLGRNGVAGEIGHMPLDGHNEQCNCGNIGCIETVCSGNYLEKLYGDDVANAFAKHGEEKVLQDFVERMAMTISTEVNILDPEMVLIGGKVLEMEGFSKDKLTERILEHTRKPYPAENLRIIYTGAAEEKGVIGASFEAAKRLRKMEEENQ